MANTAVSFFVRDDEEYLFHDIVIAFVIIHPAPIKRGDGRGRFLN